MPFFKRHWPLIIVLTLAAALRITLLFFRGTLWFDELFTIHFSTLDSWQESWRLWTLETNPPLWLFLMRFYLPLYDKLNPFFARAPAVGFALMSVVTLYYFALHLFHSRRIAAIASFFLAISGISLIATTEVRSYGMFVFLTILSFYLFYELFYEKEGIRTGWRVAVYAAVTTALFYTHLTAVLIPAIQGLTLLYLKAHRADWKLWFSTHIIAGLLWLPWIVPAAMSKLEPGTAGGWFFDDGLFGSANLLTLIGSGFFVNNVGGNFINTLVFIGIIIGFISLFNIFLRGEAPDKKPVIIMLILWGLMPIVASSLLGVFMPKYVLFAYPALYIIAGFLVDKALMHVRRPAVPAFAVLAALVSSSLMLATTPFFSWQPIMDYIARREHSRSITMASLPETLPFRYFYQGRRPVVPLYLNDDSMPFEERIVRYNWNKQNTTDAELTSWLNQRIAENNANTIFVVNNNINFSWVLNILYRDGWRLVNKITAPGYGKAQLYELQAGDNQRN